MRPHNLVKPTVVHHVCSACSEGLDVVAACFRHAGLDLELPICLQLVERGHEVLTTLAMLLTMMPSWSLGLAMILRMYLE
jgi:hypothetical protein